MAKDFSLQRNDFSRSTAQSMLREPLMDQHKWIETKKSQKLNFMHQFARSNDHWFPFFTGIP